MKSSLPEFRTPTAIERGFNRVFGFLVGLGLGFPHSYLLQVRGRKSGKLFSTPVDLLELGGKRFLVAPRGRTQWVRNAEAAGEVTLKKGKNSRDFAFGRFRRGQAGDIESLSGQFQARGADLFPGSRRLAASGLYRPRTELSGVRVDPGLKHCHGLRAKMYALRLGYSTSG